MTAKNLRITKKISILTFMIDNMMQGFTPPEEAVEKSHRRWFRKLCRSQYAPINKQYQVPLELVLWRQLLCEVEAQLTAPLSFHPSAGDKETGLRAYCNGDKRPIDLVLDLPDDFDGYLHPILPQGMLSHPAIHYYTKSYIRRYRSQAKIWNYARTSIGDTPILLRRRIHGDYGSFLRESFNMFSGALAGKDAVGLYQKIAAAALWAEGGVLNKQRGYYEGKWQDTGRAYPIARRSDLLLAHVPYQEHLQKSHVAYAKTLTAVARGQFSVATPDKLHSDGVIDESCAQLLNTMLSPPDVNVIDNDDPKWAVNANGLRSAWFDVYDTGPRSCMKGNTAVEAYGRPGNGIALVYMGDVGDVHARAIVRHKRDGRDVKEYIRAYSRSEGFTAILQRKGYTRGDLDGVELNAIPAPYGGWYMPYLDSDSCHVTLDSREEYFTIGDDGDYEACSPDGIIDGIIDGNNCTCACCGGSADSEDDPYSEWYDGTVCQSCCDNHLTYAYVGRWSQDWVPSDEAQEYNGEYYTERGMAAYDLVYCNDCGEIVSTDDLINRAAAYTCAGKRVYEVSEVCGDCCGTALDSPAYINGVECFHADDDLTVVTEDGETLFERDTVTTVGGGVYSCEDDQVIKIFTVGGAFVTTTIDEVRDNPERWVLCGKDGHYRLLPVGYYGFPLNEFVGNIRSLSHTLGDTDADLLDTIQSIIGEHIAVAA